MNSYFECFVFLYVGGIIFCALCNGRSVTNILQYLCKCSIDIGKNVDCTMYIIELCTVLNYLSRVCIINGAI